MERHIAVWNLPGRVEVALRSGARNTGLGLCGPDDSENAIALLAPPPRTADERAELERLRAAQRATPLVVLARDRREVEPRLGAHVVVPAAADARISASRLIRAALEASEERELSLIGSSIAMRALRAELRLAASAPSTVLLLGETGAGKGVAARALHAFSPRCGEPFETVDCAGLAPSLIESELFGHERGAFTGAYERHLGKLERAAEGTLFLDEIGELEVGLQTRLLRALEDRVFERVGGSSLLPVRARIVAATHRDLWSDVASGRFRRDLFYRLDVLRIRVPSLDERLGDLASLVDHLLVRAGERVGKRAPRAAPDLIEELERRRWAGNVRQLANTLEAIVVRSDSEIVTAQALAVSVRPEFARDAAVDEHGELSALLVECGGNVARVARRLGQPRSTVRSRISRLGLSRLLPRD